MRAKWQDPAFRANQSEKMRKKWEDPEYIQHQFDIWLKRFTAKEIQEGTRSDAATQTAN
jgi:hypothetical protein